MALMAVAFPILPGKTGEWREMVAELNGARSDEFRHSREQAGVHERTYLQSTPMGDLVIVTLEGDDPEASFAKLNDQKSAFATWFRERATAVHGFDPDATPISGPPSELVADSAGVATPVG
jgi:hypothetical protein